MDWYPPLWNSLRIAAISTVVIFFAGIFAAYYIAKLPRLCKGVLDVILTLPLVLPPTVVGYLLLRVSSAPSASSARGCCQTFGVKMVMTWWSAILATVVVIFPLMYRTVRGAFEALRRDAGLFGARRWACRIPTFSGGSACPYCTSGRAGRHGAGLCPGAGRIRRDEHGRRLHAGQDRHDLHHGLPALAHRTTTRLALPLGHT